MSDTLSLARKGTTHYETLGLSPTATNDEIAKAFVRHMSAVTPRPVAALAQLSVAYETLRNPEKRRAYDASLRPAPMQGYTFQWSSTPPPAQALVDRLTQPVVDRRPTVPEPPVLAPKPDVPDAETVKPPIQAARSLPEQRRRAVSDMLVMEDYPAARQLKGKYDQTAIDWKKVATALGWPILGVALIGGIAGWAANDGQKAPPDALTITLPQSEQAMKQAELALIIPPSMEEEIPAPVKRRAAEMATMRPRQSVAVRADPLAPMSDDPQTAAVAEQAPAAEIASASMPISNATIAQTIGRIGYDCGQVASTAPVGDGVFKVTCTSGHAYQARPVGGRYRFKRWARG